MNILKTILAPRSRSRVNLNDEHEVGYWIQNFNIAEAELRRIVQTVGTSVFRVEEEMKHLKVNPIRPAV